MRPTSETKIHQKELRIALECGDEILNAHVSRLCVLYEDLRLELSGATDKELKPLDANGFAFRTQYFIRRATATTIELAEEFRLLNDYNGFDSVRASFTESDTSKWNACLTFYSTHEPLFEKIRNDIGDILASGPHYMPCGISAQTQPVTSGWSSTTRKGQVGSITSSQLRWLQRR